MIAERLREAVQNTAFSAGGHECRFSVSIGLAPIDGPLDVEGVLALADRVLYTAKEDGRNRVVLSRSEDEEGRLLAAAGRWSARIKRAQNEGFLRLHLQPVVDLSTGAVCHFEGLLRLQDQPGHKPELPHSFMPHAERYGLLPDLDRWAVTEALRFLGSQAEASVFVNMSHQSLDDAHTLDLIVEMLAAHPAEAARLGFELTELTAAQDLTSTQDWMSRVKSMGCRVALDDFGAGFSSFVYLRTLQVDLVKVPGPLVRRAGSDPTDRALLQSISLVARSLGADVVAKWVEQEAVVPHLTQSGIGLGQGLLFGMARPWE